MKSEKSRLFNPSLCFLEISHRYDLEQCLTNQINHSTAEKGIESAGKAGSVTPIM